MAGKVEYVALTQEAFDKLPNYSCSLPTATTIGKQWKRQNGKGPWVMGEYAENPEPGMVTILWREIVIREAGIGPEDIVGQEEAFELWCKERERK